MKKFYEDLTNKERMEKLQLIRQEIERRLLQGEQGFEDGDAEYGYLTCLKDLKRFIDSLPKEPKFKVGDRISRKGKLHEYIFTVQEVLDDCYILDDDKMLTFNWEDAWELAQDEPKGYRQVLKRLKEKAK